MSKFAKINVLLNSEKEERFNENDVVRIETIGTYGSEYIGRINWINASKLELDISGKYVSQTKEIEFVNIKSIEAI